MLYTPDQFNAIALVCQNSILGKRLPNALYVHHSILDKLDPLLQNYENYARSNIAQVTSHKSQVTSKNLCLSDSENEKLVSQSIEYLYTDNLEAATLIKFSTDKPKISYLFYPDFDSDPHPALQLSIVVDIETLKASYWDYSDSENPPILHRKETFLTPDYPCYEEFAQLTYFEVALGLLDNSRFIGTRQEWQQRLDYHRVAFEGHRLICPLEIGSPQPIAIERHKAAIARKSLSRPVRLALEADLFTPGTTFFDYGCGYGSDIRHMAEKSYNSSGWDPYYSPNTSQNPADIVNLGYVINVIEDMAERREALVKAWELTYQVLIVAAQVLIDDRDRGFVAYGDGVITRRNTFQKYYEQEELKIYIDQVLNVDSIPIGLGIYLVFRDENQAQSFRLSRFRSRATTPRIQTKIRRFEDYEDLLIPLMEFITLRGRLPIKGELANDSDLRTEFGTMRRAFQLILQVTNPEEWEVISEKRRQELLLYLALSHFSYRPKPRELSEEMREDIKALFGSYQQACLLADMMLLSLRDLKNIADICHESPVGKKFSNSFLVHINALETLDPLLRLYEGCASRTVGRLEQANLIRFSFQNPKISYLYYHNFDIDAHPVLQTSMEIYLQDLRVRYRDFSDDDNPPILHEKDALVLPEYRLYEKFFKLTRQEKDWGLLEDFNKINRLQGWQQCLEDHCATIKGHQLFWRKDADPYKIKLLRSQINTRKTKK